MTKNTSESTKELPNGWEWKKLKNVCEKITDGTHQTPTYFDEGVIFLSSKNVTSGKIDWDNVKYIDTKQHIEMHKRVAPRLNDILLAKNGTTGVAAMVDRDVIFDIYVSLAFLRPLNTILPNYLLHYINSPQAKNQFNGRLKGAGVPNLHLEEIREVEIPLPPLIEQERIVQKLDTAFQSLDEAITLQKENIAHTQGLKKAVLVDTFENLDINCQIKPLSYFDKITSGGTPSRQVKEYWDGSINWFSSGELNYDYISESKEKITEAGLQNSNARIFPAGTLLIGMYDTAAMKMSILEKEASCNQAIVGIKPKEDILNIIFLKRQLEYLKSTILLQRQGVRQLNLNSQKIKDIEISFPPLPEQERIVAYLDTSFAKLDALIVEQEARLAQLMELKKSVLQEAFDGKL